MRCWLFHLILHRADRTRFDRVDDALRFLLKRRMFASCSAPHRTSPDPVVIEALSKAGAPAEVLSLYIKSFEK